MSDTSAKDRGRIAAFQRELAGDPRSLTFVTLAEEHNRLGEFDEAAQVAQKGLAYHPDSVAGRVALAQAEAGRNNVKQALEQLKRALLIDQENPVALALMGRILLQKGLAKRAMQFLSHAVKLAPDVAEYSELLKRARRGAQQDAAPAPPVFRAEAVKDTHSPWGGGELADADPDERPLDAEHTVFDPEALKKLRSRDLAKKAQDGGAGADLDAALGNLPSSTLDSPADAEPTRFDGRARRSTVAMSTELPPPRRVDVVDQREEPTAYAAKNPLGEERRPRVEKDSGPRRKPMVGGSAEDFSRMMRQVQEGDPGQRVEVLGRAGIAPDPDGPESSRESTEPESALGRLRSSPPPPPEAPEPPRPAREAREKVKTSSRPKVPAEDASPRAPDGSRPRRSEAPDSTRPKTGSGEVARARPGEADASVKSERSDRIEAPKPEAPKAESAKAEPARSEGTAARAAREAKDAKLPSRPEAPADEARPEKAKPEKPAKADKEAAAAEREAAKASKDAPAAASSPATRAAVGPASTRMVDEALWALLGGKAEPAEAKPVVPIERDKKPAKDEPAEGAERPAPKKEDAEKKPASPKGGGEKAGEGAARQGPMVVRTSERFGVALYVAVILVLAVASSWIGYALGVSSSGPPPEVASEEVKGIASELEKGGLASLFAAEEKVQVLSPGLPQLEALFTSVLAEIYARRWASFGRDPEMLARAKQRIEQASGGEPSVELLTAMVTVSTSAKGLAAIDAQLQRTLEEYPASPKIWLLRGKIAAAEGRTSDAEDALYAARSINPQHRGALLELARWHAGNGAYGAAFAYFDQLQSAYPNDVEVALDRYVLGLHTGRDPAEGQAAATLAGLVREELADVAKDEAGRVAIAFAVSLLARGELAPGIEELGKADAAYKKSAELKGTLASLFLAVGQWDRAKKHYASALELEPSNLAHRAGIARASYGARAGLSADPEQVSRTAAAAKRARAEAGETGLGELRLPFGTLRIVLGRFSLVEVEPAKDVFPEAEIAQALATAKGEAADKALEVATLAAIARERTRAGKPDEALVLLEEASKAGDSAAVQIELGRASVARDDNAAALRAFKRALELDASNVPARLGIAQALAREGQVVQAIEQLEKLEKGEVLSPRAISLLSELRVKRGDYEGALRSLASLVALEPHDAGAQMLLGEVQHRLQKRDQALATFAKAVEVGAKLPGKPTAIQLLYLGRLELEKNEKRGISLLEKSITAEEAPDEAHFYLGKALVEKKQTKKRGKKELELYRKLAPTGELSEEAEKLLR